MRVGDSTRSPKAKYVKNSDEIDQLGKLNVRSCSKNG
jgi:hypothetical protein